MFLGTESRVAETRQCPSHYVAYGPDEAWREHTSVSHGAQPSDLVFHTRPRSWRRPFSHARRDYVLRLWDSLTPASDYPHTRWARGLSMISRSTLSGGLRVLDEYRKRTDPETRVAKVNVRAAQRRLFPGENEIVFAHIVTS